MKKVLILSGAGISAESGIKTFRNSGGLWEEFDVQTVCSVEGFKNNPNVVNKFYDMRRQDLSNKVPNKAHHTLAKLKMDYPYQVILITQNVDDLFEKAGCKDVIHLHGTLTDLRCQQCEHVFSIGYASQEGVKCPSCSSSNIRHNVVMFGELAPMYEKLHEAINDTEYLVVIGSSGQVINVAMLAQWYEYSLLNNLDEDEFLDPFFKIVYHEKATECITKIDQEIRQFLKVK